MMSYIDPRLPLIEIVDPREIVFAAHPHPDASKGAVLDEKSQVGSGGRVGSRRVWTTSAAAGGAAGPGRGSRAATKRIRAAGRSARTGA